MARLRLLVTDDMMATREGLVAILNRVPNLEVAKVCERPDECLEAVRQQHYDLALVDLQLREENGIVLGRQLLKFDPQLKVIIYTKEASIVIAAEVFRHEYGRGRARRPASTTAPPPNTPAPAPVEAPSGQPAILPVTTGLHGYLLLKNITPASFERNLDILQQQGNVIDPEILDLVLERFQRQNLTPRETECSELISQGKSNKEIARQLGITQQAVENLINSLYNKLSIVGEPKDPGRRVLLARTMERWRGLTRGGTGPLPSREP